MRRTDLSFGARRANSGCHTDRDRMTGNGLSRGLIGRGWSSGQTRLGVSSDMNGMVARHEAGGCGLSRGARRKSVTRTVQRQEMVGFGESLASRVIVTNGYFFFAFPFFSSLAFGFPFFFFAAASWRTNSITLKRPKL